jgi:hypothetical protein
VYRAISAWAPHVTIAALFCGSNLLHSSNCVWAAGDKAVQSVSANGNEESTGENFSCKCNYSILLHNKTPIYSAWGLLRVCAACPTPRLNQSYELLPPWEQHLRYVPHRVCNGYNTLHWIAFVWNSWISLEVTKTLGGQCRVGVWSCNADITQKKNWAKLRQCPEIQTNFTRSHLT